MRFKFYQLTTFFAILVLPAMVLGPPALEAGPIRLSYANFPPSTTFPCVQMERWKVEVEKRTQGRVVVHTFPGGTLLGAKNMMDGVISGQADIGNLCMAYQPGRFTVTNATALPLGIPNAEVGSLVLLDLYEKYRPKAFSRVKVLTMFTTAPSNIMSRKPVRRLEDLKGFDLRASGGAARILKAWGANQIGMPMSSTPSALQKGVVQGVFSSLEVMKDLKFAELCRYVTMTDTVIYPFAVVMNMDRWKALPEDVKKVLNELALEQARWTGTYMDGHVKDAVDWSVTHHDVELIAPAPEERSKWDAELQPIVDQWIGQAEAKGFPGSQIVEDIHQLVDKHSR